MDSTNQVNGPIGGALKFDGTSEYIRVATTSSDPTAVNPSQLTIEAWASSSGNTGFAERIINRRHIVLLSPVESYGLATSASDGTQLIHSTGSPDLVGTSERCPLTAGDMSPVCSRAPPQASMSTESSTRLRPVLRRTAAATMTLQSVRAKWG